MSSPQRLVSPKLPTTLATHAHVDLPGYDLWLHNIKSVHVVPTELDASRLEEALSKALQLYPHAAGQLRCRDQHWSIEITNTAVPVDIEYKLDTKFDSLLKSDWVVQDNIAPFLSHQPIGAKLVNGDAPLLRLKLTFFRDETCIGVSWHHTLGDAIVLLRFMHAISQFYQGLPQQYASPTFRKHHFPTPSPLISAEYWPRMPHLHNACSFSELGERYGEVLQNVAHLRWRFETHDLTELRSALSEPEGHLSTNDCLIAYLIAILNDSRSILVQKVTNASSYRHINTTFTDENMAGNQIQIIPTTIPTDMTGIATALRQALVQAREPGRIYDWVKVASNHMLEIANDGKSFFFAPYDDVVTVNSNATIDWCSAHFGYPDGSRFYSTGMGKHYIRCFKTNPKEGDDGVWRARRSIDISMGVTAELKPRLLEILARGVQYNLAHLLQQPAHLASVGCASWSGL